MGALADEYIRLRPDVSRMPREIRKAGAVAGNDFGSSFGGVLKKVLAGAVVVGAAKVLAGALKTTVFAASDMNETFNKTQIIFGKLTPVVTKFASTAAKDLGLTKQQALESAASFGDMFTQIGFTGKQVTRMSLNVVRLAADLGSFNNLPTEDVQQRIAAAFRGEYDSLQALVPTINAAAVQQRAMTDTGKKSATQLTAQEKAAATLAIIMEKTQRASGDFARTQGGLANQVKIAKAQLGDMAVTVGNLFLPALSKLFGYITKNIIPAFQDFFDSLSKDKALKTAVQNLKDALTTLTGSQDFRQALQDTAAAIPPVVQGLADIVTKYKQISDAVDRFENKSFAAGDKRGGPVGQLVKDFGTGGTIERALIQFRGFISHHVSQAWASIKSSFAQRSAEAVAGVSQFVARIVAWFVRLKNQVVAWVKKMWADLKASNLSGANHVVADVKRFVGQMVGWFTNLWRTVTGWIRRLGVDMQRLWNASLTWLSNRWSTFWTGIKRTGSNALNSLRIIISDVLNKIKNSFGTAVTGIGRAWDRIKAIARTPVAFVVNTVLEGGLLHAFRAISNLTNYGPGKNFHVSMARGGVLPGYTPGKDVHRFYSATGGVMDLSGGEGIARPEIVRAMGKKRWDEMNREAVHGRISRAVGYLGGYFLGGTAPVPGGVSGKHSRAQYPWATWAGDFHAPTGTPVHAWNSGRVAAVKNWNYSYGHHVRINHPGNKQTLYAHLRNAIVRVGEAIGRGNVLGYSNSTGNSTGPHLHFELKGGQGVLGGKNGAGAVAPLIDTAKYIGQVVSALAKLKGIGGGQFGQMVAAAARLIGDKVKDKITSLADSFNGAAGTMGAGRFTAAGGGSNRAIGKRMMLQRWGASQWPPLNSLWTKESGWRTTARNPSSGAYGIPQALPASKMASAGSDWRTNPTTQIKWGLGYIASRYGSPAAAWRHSQATNWYGLGGVINEPVMGLGMRTGARYGFGEHGPETVTPGRGGGRAINIIIDLGDGLAHRVQGILDENDEFHAAVGRMR